ncbi:hypothetical protein B0T10DRAFT_97852 [Thelonectria olida]|uniref:Uncharacterized protein n=1 Tax=Thelonectria olida TaxID=1576542 RepID=A0A9P8VZ48_9HYPO|nr:hypothetical protein B0T10DRAFT_97852 [Thelonectria olida]
MPAPTPWIFTQSRDFPPDASLKLGQILSDPKNPHTQLVFRKGKLIPARIQLNKSCCSNLELERSDELENRFNAWAKVFGRPLGLSGEAKTTNKWEENWTFEELHGEVMPFDYKFGEEALKDDNVKRWIESQFFMAKCWKRLYMVTGVRWAKGAKLQSKRDKTFNYNATVGADLTPKVPLHLAVGAGTEGAEGQKQSFEKASDFVFQYCLYEIKYSGKFKASAHKHGETEADSDDEEPVATPGPTEIESLTFMGFGEAIEAEDIEEESPGLSEHSY